MTTMYIRLKSKNVHCLYRKYLHKHEHLYFCILKKIYISLSFMVIYIHTLTYDKNKYIFVV